MATSACCARDSRSWPSSGYMAMPSEGVTISSCSRIWMGAAMASISLRARCAAPSASVLGKTSTNSSPPMRATVSCSRTCWRMRRATAMSSSSPMPCPSESLMFLKWSRSRNISASGSPPRSAMLRSCAKRSLSKARLGSPVSRSKCAIHRMRCSSALRWLTSEKMAMKCVASPSALATRLMVSHCGYTSPFLRWFHISPCHRLSAWMRRHMLP